jgi:hypothetical protein
LFSASSTTTVALEPAGEGISFFRVVARILRLLVPKKRGKRARLELGRSAAAVHDQLGRHLCNERSTPFVREQEGETRHVPSEERAGEPR